MPVAAPCSSPGARGRTGGTSGPSGNVATLPGAPASASRGRALVEHRVLGRADAAAVHLAQQRRQRARERLAGLLVVLLVAAQDADAHVDELRAVDEPVAAHAGDR